MTTDITTREQLLIAAGGNLWEKGDYRRVYFPERLLATLLGYQIETYRSGGVASATRDGSKVSNATMNRVLDDLRKARFHYDLVRGTYSWYDTISRATAEALIEALDNA